MEERLKALEARVETLEKEAVLFEAHRQSWIRLNEGVKQMKEEMDQERGN